MNSLAKDIDLKQQENAVPIFHGHQELAQLTAAAEAISFDFFDTLFVRPLGNPEDAFDILARKFSIPDFRERRRAAQVEAFRRMNQAGRKEITLEDIYVCLTDTGLPGEEMMRAEYALELALIEPNPEIFGLFRELLEAGKLVVITSDMYLSDDFFVEALRPHGFANVPLFISSDCNATKRDTGELFDVLVSRIGLPPGSILHIGDSELADVIRPREKGLMTFHYRPSRELRAPQKGSLSASISHGLLRTRVRNIPPHSYTALGFNYGGPAAVGFLQWIEERAKLDRIDHVLFLSRDGFVLDRIARAQTNSQLPAHCYFLGSRTAFKLAAIKDNNFNQFLPFLLSGSGGLSPCEVLERIGVQPPSPQIMTDLGLGHEVRITPALTDKLESFLYAYRWEILKVCQRNRRALYLYLRQVGLRAGSRVAFVDLGWSGSSQEAFEMAAGPLMDLRVFGYYFCLADTPERLQREQKQNMSAMVSTATVPSEIIASVYAHRVAVELFFSAPHQSIIGLEVGAEGVKPVMDSGRGDTSELLQIAKEVGQGVEAFATHYSAMKRRLDFQEPPLQIAWPMIELITKKPREALRLLRQVKNFDAWGSSRNHELVLADYLTTAKEDDNE